MEAAELVRDARRRNGMTQRQLAAAAGMAQSVIARIERGGQQPSLRVLSAVLAGVGERPVLSSEPVADEHDLGLLEVTMSLSPQERIRRLVVLHQTAARWQEAAQR